MTAETTTIPTMAQRRAWLSCAGVITPAISRRHQQHGELEADAEDDDHQHHQLQVVTDVVDLLDVRATHRVQEDEGGQQRHVGHRRPHQEEGDGTGGEGHRVLLLVRVEARRDEAPQLPHQHGHGQDDAHVAGDLDAGQQRGDRAAGDDDGRPVGVVQRVGQEREDVGVEEPPGHRAHQHGHDALDEPGAQLGDVLPQRHPAFGRVDGVAHGRPIGAGSGLRRVRRIQVALGRCGRQGGRRRRGIGNGGLGAGGRERGGRSVRHRRRLRIGDRRGDGPVLF